MRSGGTGLRAPERDDRASPKSVQKQLELVLAGEALSKSATNRRLLSYHGEAIAYRQRKRPRRTGNRNDGSLAMRASAALRIPVCAWRCRGLRQKLLEHYTGAGRNDELVFDIPEGGVSDVTVSPRAMAPPVKRVATAAAAPPKLRPVTPSRSGPRRSLAARGCGAHAAARAQSRAASPGSPRPRTRTPDCPGYEQRPVGAHRRGRRPLMFVLGDLFMYTPVGPQHGPDAHGARHADQYQRGSARLPCDQPCAGAAERGLRYSTALRRALRSALVEILQIWPAPAVVEVRLRDELRAEDIQRYDIVYVGPITRLGPRPAITVRSRYQFDRQPRHHRHRLPANHACLKVNSATTTRTTRWWPATPGHPATASWYSLQVDGTRACCSWYAR